MSMILVLRTISEDTAEKVITDPPLIWRLLAPDDPEIYLNEVSKRRSASFLSRLFGRKGNTTNVDIPTLDLDESEGVTQDLDKAWHGIHYLLTKTAWREIHRSIFC